MNRNYWLIGAIVLVVPLITIGFSMMKTEAAQERPFQASGPEAVTFEGPDPDVCGEGRLKVDVEGTGEATHLGEYQITRRHCFNPGNNPPTFEDGIFEMTAANGDVLSGTYAGALADVLEVDQNGNPVVIVIDAPYVITGGTGRFADAAGEGETEGIFNLQTQQGDFTMEGWIRY
ncbi:MAG: hypothetical protein ACLFWD_01500 [Anaerolineales bacterium]